MWHVWGRRGGYRVLVGRTDGERPFGRPMLGGRIILKWIFKRFDGEAWTGLPWLWVETGSGDL
jgi:hypothetical protein